jgi:hypothetical protein
MSIMVECGFLASRADLGAVAVVLGFDPSLLECLLDEWQLHLVPAARDAAYLIEAAAWTPAAETVWSNSVLTTDSLVCVQAGDEDALVGASGIVWLMPGRRSARVSLRPGTRVPFGVDTLVGAGFAHALALQGRVTLHGMAASLEGSGVLALGETMSGKTTLALAMLHAGGRVVSDDYLVVAGDPEEPELRGLRRDLYVREGSFGVIPGDLSCRFSAARARPGWRVLRHDQAPEVLIGAVRPDVVWILGAPRVDSATELRQMSQAEALASMISIANPLFVGGRYRLERANSLPCLTTIIETARCVHVRLGPELLGSPGTVIKELVGRTTRCEESTARLP